MHSLFLLLRIRCKENIKGKKILFQACIAVIVFIAVYQLDYALAKAGIASILPTISYFFASTFAALITMISIYDLLQGFDDSEFLLSTPIPLGAQILMMYLSIYLKSFVQVLVICLPSGIVYTQFCQPEAFWGGFIGGIFLTSLPLGGIASFFGTILALSLAHFPRKEEIQTMITLVIVGIGTMIVLFVIYRMGDLMTELSQNSAVLSEEVKALFVSNFRFTRMYHNAVIERRLAYRLLFPFMSMIWYGAFGITFAAGYRTMIISFRCPVEKVGYRSRQIHSRSLFLTLLTKELQQIIRSRTYVTRILTGLIICFLVSLSTLIFSADLFTRLFQDWQIILMLSLFMVASCAVSYSFELEKKNAWILQSAGISKKQIFAIKILANQIFQTIGLLCSATILIITMKPKGLWGIGYLLVPFMVSLITNLIEGRLNDKK